jgi:hypothetical protein
MEVLHISAGEFACPAGTMTSLSVSLLSLTACGDENIFQGFCVAFGSRRRFDIAGGSGRQAEG